MAKLYNVNPGSRGISQVMKLIDKQFLDATLEPYSQVSLRVGISDSEELDFCEFLNQFNIFYTEIKNDSKSI